MRPFDLPRNGFLTLRNAVRSLRRRGLDFVVLPLEGSFPERAQRRPPLPFPLSLFSMLPSEASLEEMQETIDLLGADRRVVGVIFRLRGLQAGPASLYALRRLITELHERGKHTVAWLSSADTWEYYLATACEEIIMAPPGRLRALGLRTEALFLKDTLAMAGIKADLESIAEYKVTPDMFRRSSMTEPHRQMLEAILDSVFDHFITAVSQQRNLTRERVRELIDEMPMTPEAAQEAGLIDAVLYEDELAARLSKGERLEEGSGNGREAGGNKQAVLVPLDRAARWLRRPLTWTTSERIGVISVQGMIVPGKSRRMPTPSPLPIQGQAGAETLTAALRQAETDPRIVAVILHVDSPGGSSLASDLIWRQIRRLRERKPVVALMGDQAASGGYYVSAPAHRIVARPTTLTGSIGIWGGKFIMGDLYDRLAIGHRELQRGAQADLYSELRPFNERERDRIREELASAYGHFKEVVAEGRGMSIERVEEIGRGRVWTGERAVEIGLVDELGDFETALAAAKELAKLDLEKDYTIVQIRPPRQELLPEPFPANTEARWGAIRAGLEELACERVWAVAPWTIRLRG